MMDLWEVRLAERMAHGAAKHGAVSLQRPPEDLLRELLNEACDIAGWSYTIHVRSAAYLDPLAFEFVDGMARRAAQHSLFLFRAVHALTTWIERDVPKASDILEPATWLRRERDGEDDTYPQILRGHWAAGRWRDATVARLEYGHGIYGDESFRRDAGELCLELGDELCGLAGWAWVLRNRLSRAPLIDVVDRQLAGLVRCAHHIYGRTQAMQLVCVGHDGRSWPFVSSSLWSPPAAQAWLEHAVSSERRVGPQKPEREP